jgi:branched-chain amino acid transport system permease protein
MLAAGRTLRLPTVVAVLIGILSACAVAILMDWVVFGPLRKRRASDLIAMLASLGAYTAAINIISIAFGDEPHRVQSGASTITYVFWGLVITQWQLMIFGTAVALAVSWIVLAKCTVTGALYRATASDLELATICGAPVGRILFVSVAIGGALAGLVGILAALDTLLDPDLGLRLLFSAVVVVVAGGRGSVAGMVTASLLIAGMQASVVGDRSSAWRDVITFAVLVVAILFRPHGFGVRTQRTGLET